MHTGLTPSVEKGLAVFYVLAAVLNAGYAYYHVKHRNRPQALLWLVVAGVFLAHAFAYLSPAGAELVIPESVTHAVNVATNAVSYFVLSTVAFILVLVFRKQLTAPPVAWALLNVALLAFGWSLTNPDFRAIVAKEDNVPIVMLIAVVGFFTWFGLRRAVLNDQLISAGKPPLEKDDDKVLVWPDLVYTELICMVIATAALIVWSVLLKAPLEQPATSAKAPNPSKAPWYFLGLQEMLVYFDPWMAGVVLPTMIIVGLIAMPYIDFNQKGNGYYTFNERKFALSVWMYGFVVLWVVLIVLGTFLRGPNWNFFGPFEHWDPHKVDPLNNVNLSEMFWVGLLGDMPDRHHWFVRELPGILLVLAYLLLLPPLLARLPLFRGFFLRMGFARYMLLITLLQFMAALPIKMVLRWTLNLKYIVYIPEYFFNI
jgi:hypothetical protein